MLFGAVSEVQTGRRRSDCIGFLDFFGTHWLPTVFLIYFIDYGRFDVVLCSKSTVLFECTYGVRSCKWACDTMSQINPTNVTNQSSKLSQINSTNVSNLYNKCHKSIHQMSKINPTNVTNQSIKPVQSNSCDQTFVMKHSPVLAKHGRA